MEDWIVDRLDDPPEATGMPHPDATLLVLQPPSQVR